MARCLELRSLFTLSALRRLMKSIFACCLMASSLPRKGSVSMAGFRF